MGDYTDAIERINIELSFKNKLRLLDELQQHLAGELQLGEPIGERKAEAQQVLTETRARWAYLGEHLDTPLVEALPRLAQLGFEPLRAELERRAQREPNIRVFDILQDRSIRTSWKSEVRAHLRRLFGGEEFAAVLRTIEEIHQRVLRGRVWIALHMGQHRRARRSLPRIDGALEADAARHFPRRQSRHRLGAPRGR